MKLHIKFYRKEPLIVVDRNGNDGKRHKEKSYPVHVQKMKTPLGPTIVVLLRFGASNLRVDLHRVSHGEVRMVHLKFVHHVGMLKVIMSLHRTLKILIISIRMCKTSLVCKEIM